MLPHDAYRSVRLACKIADTPALPQAALENLARARVKPNRVSWVLTVPACCTAPATKFMSDAAIRAGLINGEDDAEHLTICKEPVAACLALEDRLDWSVNDMYLVVDCGGGTVDICAFKLAQLGPPILDQVGDNISESWGSTYVDEQFRVFLMTFADSVAPRAGHFQLESFERDGMYKVLQNWEEAKVGLSVDKPECRIDMSEMVEALGVSQPAMAMDTARKKTNNGGQDLVGGSGTELVLKPALLTRFFRTQCDRIAGAVSEKLKTEELRGLKSVVMVGGFAGSMHVQAAVRKSVLEEYPNKSVQVVVATSPDLAVVQGAALYVGPLGPRPKYPTSAPEMNGITCGSSYGILTSGRGTWDAKFFEAVLLKGEAYPNGHTKDFDYTVGSDCKLAFGSCGASEVKEGRNRLDSIGGIGAVHITVSETIPVPGGWDMCCCRRSTSAVEQDENGIKEGETPIKVEFTIIGVVLHVKVKSKRGRVLMKQVVPGCGS
ncbi:Heat shock protein 70-putative [Ectocarpus siliculosus]|uniref:Heat shock protein 70-putative n=1 Tax=Ectocarpus siliculosus TaxID=2880 RepID=D7FRC9_ECTSI|nr:Heat shock protein 70-putative [Ectocarpus siliculosus]|eukprot:CBJ30720.1 Heat shock protein 70-putative [Ectocarpus siliculosus]